MNKLGKSRNSEKVESRKKWKVGKSRKSEKKFRSRKKIQKSEKVEIKS
jgi:hypothetical protein